MNDISNKNSNIIGNIEELSLKLEQKESIIQFWKTIFPEFQDKNLSLIYSHHVNEIDGNYLNKANMYLLELKPNEFDEWINAIVLPKENINGKISVDEF